MCGIFGMFARASVFSSKVAASAFNRLLILSESRGKEASGIAFLHGNKVRIFKQPISPSEMIRSSEYKKLLKEFTSSESSEKNVVAMMGHSRLVTNGDQNTRANNQPVNTVEMTGIHNGIIVNVDDLWKKFPQFQRQSDVDTEILFRLIHHFIQQTGSLVKGVQAAYGEIYGVANIAVFLKDFGQVLLATNNGSLYLCTNEVKTALFFASEEYILQTFLKKERLEEKLGKMTIVQLRPGKGILIDLEDVSSQSFSLDSDEARPAEKRRSAFEIEEIEGTDLPHKNASSLPPSCNKGLPGWILEEYERNKAAISRLKRCKKCVLPETMPFIELDEEGVCIDCRRHEHAATRTFLGHEALASMVAPYRSRDGRPDCLIPISGGRDSCYTLHYFKKVLNMNPLAYTYDWGMVTDLARRNISRMCSRLGVEHILISADITRKRDNIRKNVEAWLNQPDMGIIPLFMAGDKHFFYHAHQLRKHSGIQLMVFSMNALENTDFKTGFCGIGRGTGKGRKGGADTPGSKGSLKMILYYLKSFLKNPGYLNSSLFDTFTAYLIYYLMPIHNDYVLFEDYIKWDEETLVSTLLKEYDWELSPDTKTTWRIGDGTVPFYNYIYYTVAGFTENETFRSNQIREGMITREEALKFLEEENLPRFESFYWYCNTIGVDPEKCIRVIHSIPKLYKI